MLEQAEDLLYSLRFRREEPQQLKRPLFFVCHSFGGLVLKNVSVIRLLNSATEDNSPGAAHCKTPRRFSGHIRQYHRHTLPRMYP